MIDSYDSRPRPSSENSVSISRAPPKNAATSAAGRPVTIGRSAFLNTCL
jgi:hypothetical protein